jgi:hypothetical protein
VHESKDENLHGLKKTGHRADRPDERDPKRKYAITRSKPIAWMPFSKQRAVLQLQW